MRILHVIPGLTRERGGPSVVVEALVRHLAAAGHEVAVLTTDQGARHGEEPVDLAVAVERVAVRGPDRIAYAPGFAQAMRAQLRSCDVVHVHSLFTYPAHVALREARAAGVPAVLRPCGHLHRYSLRRSAWRKQAYLRLWGRMVWSACTAWHYTSEDEARASWPWDGSPHFVLPNGIEPADFVLDRNAAREEVGRRWPQLGKAPYILFLGRLHPKKRLDLLLDAFLAAAPRSYKLVVAGPDECGLWLGLSAQFVTGPGAVERVHRVGIVSGRDKIALLAGARLFALPSEHENFGIAVLEALAAGTPVLVSPHVDCAAGLGCTVPLEPAAWRERLVAALGSEAGPDHEASRLRAWVGERYAWRKLTDELLRHYERLIRTGTRIPQRDPIPV